MPCRSPHDGRPRDSLSPSNPSRTPRPSSRSPTRCEAKWLRPRANPSCGLLVARGADVDRLRQEAEQEIGGLRSRTRRADDRTIVLAPDLHPPAGDIGSATGRNAAHPDTAYDTRPHRPRLLPLTPPPP